MMARYFFKIAYRGTDYGGWQIQPNSKTIQGEIEHCLSQLFASPVSIMGCGRTDAGVHASCYYFHTDLPADVDKQNTVFKLNKMLSRDIAIYDSQKMAPDSHARFDARQRSYTYLLHTIKDPFLNQSSFHYTWKKSLDLDKLLLLSQFIEQQALFEPLCKSNSGNEHFKCEIFSARWQELGRGQYRFDIVANRFLRGMIRLMVGMYLNFERDKISLEEIERAFADQQQLAISWSVPAIGLSLSDVIYDFTQSDE